MDDAEKQRNYAIAEKLFAEQNFVAAAIAGAVACVLAAVAYAIVVAMWGYAYGFAAAAVGVAVGIAMQYLGRGIASKFGVLAAMYTIIGCLLGNVFWPIIMLARAGAISPTGGLSSESLAVLFERALSNLGFIDLVYWFVAVFAAVFLAKRPLSREQRLAIGLYEMRS